MNWVDIALLAIIFWSTWRGLETGLVAGIARILGLFLGIIFAFNYCRPLASYINDQWHLQEKIQGWFPLPFGSATGSFLPPGWEKGLDLPPQLINPETAFKNLNFVQGILEVIAFLTIFIVVSRLVYLVGTITTRTARWTFLGPADRLGGLALGIVRGVVLVLVLLAILLPLQVPVSMFTDGQGNFLTRGIEQSKLAPLAQEILLKLHLFFPGLPIQP